MVRIPLLVPNLMIKGNLMNKMYSLFAVLFVSASAFAGYGSMTIGEYAQLPDCGGTVKVTSSDNQGTGQVNVVFSNVVNCSNFDILAANGQDIGYSSKKLQGKSNARAGSFTLPKGLIDQGFNSIQVVVKSDSGHTSDTINVLFIQPSAPSAPSTGGSAY
jgi:hypothetical protein